MRKAMLLVSAFAVVALPAMPALAQQGVYAEGSDIIVTARQRDETLLEVPVAVNAIGGEELSRLSMTDTRDLAKMAPSLSIGSSMSGAGAVISLRGIGTSPSNSGFEQAVSVNIDGMQTGRARVVSLGLLDVAQVQVMKGPQALFFGKNSPAGVVSIETVSPGDIVEGYVRAGYEFVTREPMVEGAITLPLTDTLGVRLAGRYSNMTHGYIRNVAQPIANPFDVGTMLPGAAYDRGPNAKSGAGRLTVKWEPSSNFDATLKLLYSNYRDRGGASGEEVFTCGANPHPTTINLLDPTQAYMDPFGDCAANHVISTGNAPKEIVDAFVGGQKDGKPFSSTEIIAASYTMNYKADNLTLTSISSFYHHKQAGYDQFDVTVFGQAIDAQEDKDSQFSQELRLSSDFSGPLNFTIGGYYEHDDHKVMNTDKIFVLGFYPGVGPFAGASNTLMMNGRVRSTSYSAFGQLSWKILPELELAGGARYSHDERKGELGNVFNFFDIMMPSDLNPFSPVGVVYYPRLKSNNVSPEVTLSYHPAPDLTIYGAYKTGYLGGGIAMPANVSNFTGLADPTAPLVYGETKVAGGEIGFKGILLDGRMRTEVTLFCYTYKGLQVQTLDPRTLNYSINNAGKSRNQGIEAQVNFDVSREFSVHASASYFDLKFLEYKGAECYPGQTPAQGCVGGSQDLGGSNYGDGPFQMNIGASVDAPVSPHYNLTAAADLYTYSKGRNFQGHPLAFTPAYTLVNGSIGLRQADGPFEIALIGTNLTNSTYWKNFIFKPLGAPNDIAAESINAPRRVRLQATYRF